MSRPLKSLQTGRFTLPDGRQLFGELLLDGRDSLLTLRGDEFILPGSHSGMTIRGVLHDGKHVTLLHCLSAGTSQLSRSGYPPLYSARVFPHYVTVGSAPFVPDRPNVIGYRFTFPDAFALFYDFDAFSILVDDKGITAEILRRERSPREIPGRFPLVAYFTGDTELVEVSTKLGALSVHHHPQWTMGGPRGVRIDNTIWVHLAQSAPVTLDQVLESVHPIFRFFDLLIGRQQEIASIHVETAEPEDGAHFEVLISHFPKPPAISGEEFDAPHPSDLLIDVMRERALFVDVAANWLSGGIDRLPARSRFYHSFRQNRIYSADRLTGIANAFDLHPPSAGPSSPSIPANVLAVADSFRISLEALPAGIERDSLLNAIGRLKTPTLKVRVRHRARIVLDAESECFPSLLAVCNLAIDLRNHLVHGSPVGLDVDRSEVALSFLTSTLEFVFGVSELIECGWSLKSYIEKSKTDSHPFSLYIRRYKDDLERISGELGTVAWQRYIAAAAIGR